MRKYRVSVNGRNFIMDFDEVPGKYGFYTTRYVEGKNAEEAERIAVDMIRNEEDLRSCVLNQKDDPPMIYVEEIDELESFDGIDVPGKGHVFYPEEEQ